MKRYANASGHSGVVAYETSPGAIDVQFRDGNVYRYTHASAGRSTVERMKQLAASGRGLATYITRHVPNRHGARLT